MLNQRVQVLFDKDLWQVVKLSAFRQGISVGEAIRTAVRKVYVDQDMIERRRELLAKIEELNGQVKGRVNKKTIKEWVKYGRRF